MLLDGKRTEGLVGDVEIPEVDAEVVGAHVRFAVRIDADGVDVVRVGVGVHLAGDGSDDGVVVGHAGEPEDGKGGGAIALGRSGKGGGGEKGRREGRGRSGGGSGSTGDGGGPVVLGDDLETLFKHLPELDRFICRE